MPELERQRRQRLVKCTVMANAGEERSRDLVHPSHFRQEYSSKWQKWTWASHLRHVSAGRVEMPDIAPNVVHAWCWKVCGSCGSLRTTGGAGAARAAASQKGPVPSGLASADRGHHEEEDPAWDGHVMKSDSKLGRRNTGPPFSRGVSRKRELSRRPLLPVKMWEHARWKSTQKTFSSPKQVTAKFSRRIVAIFLEMHFANISSANLRRSRM